MLASGVGPGEHGESTGIWIINVLAATPRQVRGNAEAAVPSPDGTKIAFRSSNSPEIAVIDVNGENYRVLATATLNENFGTLQWSPDGKRLGVIVRRIGDPVGVIEAIDLEGGKRTELARVPRPRSFVWLDDGRMVVGCSSAADADTAELHEIDTRGRDTRLPVAAGYTVAQISATSDGKRLALVRENQQADAYVANVAAGGTLEDPRRITLDDRDDFPTAWLRDGRTILFSSTRNGTLDVFRQPIDSPTAEQLAAGAEQQFGAELTPDGKSILYWSSDDKKTRLMTMPAAGGPADVLLEAPQGSTFHCAAAACFLGSIGNASLQLSSFSGVDAKLTPVRNIPVKGDAAALRWAISADGKKLAVADADGMHAVDLGGGASWDVAAEKLPGKITGISAAAGGWFVTTNAARTNELLLVGPSSVRQLWTSSRAIFAPILSPDGKHMLFGVTSTNSNAWLLENF